MSSSKQISHLGKVVEINLDSVTVEIISQSACASCHAKSLCSISETKEKLVVVPIRGWDNYAIGDEVEVLLKASMGFKAVWIAYVLPLFVLMISLIISLQIGTSELLSGLIAIAFVAIYYLFIWLFRKKLQNEYIFNIKKK